jgi:hypothetical protein
MVSRQQERFGGIFIATMGTILTVWNWQSALSNGRFYIKAAMLGTAFVAIGLGLILFPGYKTERIERGEDISQLTGAALITPRWWGILAIALGSGFINLAALKGWQF